VGWVLCNCDECVVVWVLTAVCIIVLIVLHRYSKQNKQPLECMQRREFDLAVMSVFARQNKRVVSLPNYG